jgi:hypothetical protein
VEAPPFVTTMIASSGSGAAFRRLHDKDVLMFVGVELPALPHLLFSRWTAR